MGILSTKQNYFGARIMLYRLKKSMATFLFTKQAKIIFYDAEKIFIHGIKTARNTRIII